MLKVISGGIDTDPEPTRVSMGDGPSLRFEISRDGIAWKAFTPSFLLDGTDVVLTIPHDLVNRGWCIFRIVRVPDPD